MNNKDTGGTAFPSFEDEHYYSMGEKVKRVDTQGMSLRDYMAIHADVPFESVSDGFFLKHNIRPCLDDHATYAAQIRYLMADAMIAERAK